MASRRRYLAAVAVVAASAAGCSEFAPSDGPGDATGRDDSDGSEDSDPTGGTDGPTGTPTETASGHEELAQQPDPDLPIAVENRHDETRSLSLTVARNSGDVVHESVHELESGEDYVAYNLKETDPDGVERFDVAVEAGGNRREVSVRTNACYGEARVGFDSAGALFATYSIC